MQTYASTIAALNIAFEKDVKEFNKLMNGFAQKASSYTETEWLAIPEDIEIGRIAVFAHSKRPIRALGHVFFHDKLQKLVFQRIWFDHKTDKMDMERPSRKSLELYTCRRGFWLVLKKSLDLNFWFVELHDRERVKELHRCYKTYVDGMDVAPDKTIPFSRTEQFMVGMFPTTEWRDSVHKKMELAKLKPKKKKGHHGKSTGKRKQSGSLEEEDDEDDYEDSEDESNDWEVVDSANVTENPSRYVVVRSAIEKYVPPTMEVKIFPDMIPCNSTMQCLEELVPALLDEYECV